MTWLRYALSLLIGLLLGWWIASPSSGPEGEEGPDDVATRNSRHRFSPGAASRVLTGRAPRSPRQSRRSRPRSLSAKVQARTEMIENLMLTQVDDEFSLLSNRRFIEMPDEELLDHWDRLDIFVEDQPQMWNLLSEIAHRFPEEVAKSFREKGLAANTEASGLLIQAWSQSDPLAALRFATRQNDEELDEEMLIFPAIRAMLANPAEGRELIKQLPVNDAEFVQVTQALALAIQGKGSTEIEQDLGNADPMTAEIARALPLLMKLGDLDTPLDLAAIQQAPESFAFFLDADFFVSMLTHESPDRIYQRALELQSALPEATELVAGLSRYLPHSAMRYSEQQGPLPDEVARQIFSGLAPLQSKQESIEWLERHASPELREEILSGSEEATPELVLTAEPAYE